MGEPDTYCQVQGEPDQTWLSLIKSRIVAWGAVFSAIKGASIALGHERFDKFENGFSEHLVCKPLGFATHINGQETRAFRLGKLTALDVFATAAAATILYGASRVFAEPDKGKLTDAPEDASIPIACAPEPAKAVQPESKPIAGNAIAPKNLLDLASKKPEATFADAALKRRKKDFSMALAE